MTAPAAESLPGTRVPAGSTALTDELRNLFDRGEHESLVVRAEQLLKRKRVFDPATRNVIIAARAASLIHLSRGSEAVALLDDLAAQGDDAPAGAIVAPLVQFARFYVAWSSSEGAAEAAEKVKEIKGENARRLEAQLLYRNGRYGEAAVVFGRLLEKARAELEGRRKPATTSRWGIASVTGRVKATTPSLTAAEMEHFTSLINELATNCMAALVLDGQIEKAESLGSGLKASFEIEYNMACAKIAEKDYNAAKVSLEKAEALLRADLDEEEVDIESTLSPNRVQSAYLTHLSGDVEEAHNAYTQIMADRKADAASLAVAANNLTVALGQLAFGKKEAAALDAKKSAPKNDTADSKPVLPKEQHEALVEGLKKMRATSGKNVERKLALNQRLAMARNRAILLVQMRRFDACRAELTKLESEFPKDPLVPLIEASLVSKQGNLEIAEGILERAGDGDILRAARVELVASQEDYKKAADLLLSFFPQKPAAIVTAADLLEQSGDVDGAVILLQGLVDRSSAADFVAARTALSNVLIRTEKYKEAADVLREVCKSNPSNAVAQAQFIVAASYVNPDEAEKASMLLPVAITNGTNINAEQLEAQPPPRQKNNALRKNVNANGNASDHADETAARAAAMRERKKKKRKKRLPKDYDPDGPPPDPERWLPKTLRSGYKKKKVRNDRNAFRGSQGADAVAAEAAATKNAERSAAKAAAAAADGPLPPSGRAKVQRKKKNRR